MLGFKKVENDLIQKASKSTFSIMKVLAASNLDSPRPRSKRKRVVDGFRGVTDGLGK